MTRRTRRRRTRQAEEEEEQEEQEEEEDEEATDIKSNNPHLAGGEKRVCFGGWSSCRGSCCRSVALVQQAPLTSPLLIYLSLFVFRVQPSRFILAFAYKGIAVDALYTLLFHAVPWKCPRDSKRDGRQGT